jgi:O-methyltransferase
VNLYKLTGPDTAIGKLLLVARAEWQLLGLRFGRGGGWDPEFARLGRKLASGYTMVSMVRLKKLYELGAELGRSDIAGAVAECGVWNGGSSAMVAAGLASTATTDSTERPFWLFDSFEGLPEPTEDDDAQVRDNYFPGWCTGAVDRVREAHRIAGHPMKQTTIVPGWFDDTLAEHAATIGPIALLHIDADWYDSVMTVLNTLYDQVAPGGIIVIDDYGSWSGCRKAIHAYFGEEGVTALKLRAIDGNAVYFYKPE